MMTHWTIKIMNAVFVWSLGATIIWLFSRALMLDWAAKRTLIKDAPLFLNILRDCVPYLKIPLEKKRYSIGREAGCDIPLKGLGIPPRAGEVSVRDGCCIFNHFVDDPYSNDNIGKRVTLKPGQKLTLYNYILQIEER